MAHVKRELHSRVRLLRSSAVSDGSGLQRTLASARECQDGRCVDGARKAPPVDPATLMEARAASGVIMSDMRKMPSVKQMKILDQQLSELVTKYVDSTKKKKNVVSS